MTFVFHKKVGIEEIETYFSNTALPSELNGFDGEISFENPFTARLDVGQVEEIGSDSKHVWFLDIVGRKNSDEKFRIPAMYASKKMFCPPLFDKTKMWGLYDFLNKKFIETFPGS